LLRVLKLFHETTFLIGAIKISQITIGRINVLPKMNNLSNDIFHQIQGWLDDFFYQIDY